MDPEVTASPQTVCVQSPQEGADRKVSGETEDPEIQHKMLGAVKPSRTTVARGEEGRE